MDPAASGFFRCAKRYQFFARWTECDDLVSAGTRRGSLFGNRIGHADVSIAIHLVSDSFQSQF